MTKVFGVLGILFSLTAVCEAQLGYQLNGRPIPQGGEAPVLGRLGRPGAVLILPPSANRMQVPRILPMEPMGRTVINPWGVQPGQPGFRYRLEEDE